MHWRTVMRATEARAAAGPLAMLVMAPVNCGRAGAAAGADIEIEGGEGW